MSSWMPRKQSGFTVSEVIVVLVIVAIISAFGVPFIIDRFMMGPEERFESDRDKIQEAVDAYNRDVHDLGSREHWWPTADGGAGIVLFNPRLTTRTDGAGPYIGSVPGSAAEVGGDYRWALDSRGRVVTTYKDSAEFGLVLDLTLNDGSGGVAEDSSADAGHDNDGLLHGPLWVAGMSGLALSFQGDAESGDSVRIDDSTSLDLTGPVTMEAWISPDDISSAGYIIAKNRRHLDKMSYALYLESDESINIALDDNLWNTRHIVPVGEWHHLAVTWDGVMIKLYDNGTEVWETYWEGDLTPNDYWLRVGACNDNGNSGRTEYHFGGSIDEVRIYDRALSPNEVKARYDAIS